jgi:alpha-glutamyl/putrescinyl thymine pyrophosphorylase clade 1
MILIEPEHALFQYWQRERENIRRKKEAGQPRPWTKDPILDKYRFCNVHREDDKVTRYINDCVRVPYRNFYTLPLMLAICRWINLPETITYLMTTEGWPHRLGWGQTAFYDALKARKKQGLKIYNAAYVISPCGNSDKELFVTQTINEFYRNLRDLPITSLEMAQHHIELLHGWGQFMTYQVVIDLRHTIAYKNAPDVRTFAAYGPGTRRGFNRLFGYPLEKQLPKQLLDEGLKILQSLNDLEASDICNCLCEFDKYSRAKNGEGKPKQIYR